MEASRKNRAYSLLHQALAPVIHRVFGTNCYDTDQPLQTIHDNWQLFSSHFSPTDKVIIKQLEVARQVQHMNRGQVDALIKAMITLLNHAGLSSSSQTYNLSQLLGGSKPMQGGVGAMEGAALVGGLLAAGYLLYDTFVGDNSESSNNNNSNGSHPALAPAPVPVPSPSPSPSIAPPSISPAPVSVPYQPDQHVNPDPLPPTNNEELKDDDKESPFMCPITLQIMRDPVMTPQGICFERQAITDWLSKSTFCPVTHKPLSVDQLITCYALKNAIQEYEKLRSSISTLNLSTSSITPTSNSSATSSSLSSSYTLPASSIPSAPAPELPSQPSSTPPSAPPPDPSTVPFSPVPAHGPSFPIDSTSSIQPIVQQPPAPPITIEVAPKFRDDVRSATGSALRSEDSCSNYPLNSLYVLFPASIHYLVSRSTGYVVLQNRSDIDVTLTSRQREATLWDPLNVGGAKCASFILRAHSSKGFDFRGWYCIEVEPDPQGRPISLYVSDYAIKGGGKGSQLAMGTGK